MRKIWGRLRLNTFGLLVLSLAPMVMLVFFFLLVGLQQQLSGYIRRRNATFVDTVTQQIGWRLNATLENTDISLQRFCNDEAMQQLLYNSVDGQTVLGSESIRHVRNKVQETKMYAEVIDSIALYSLTDCIYPETGTRAGLALDEDVLARVEAHNGAIVWLGGVENGGGVTGIKKILLPDHDFVHAGYLVVTLKEDFLAFLEDQFQTIEGGAIVVSQEDGRVLASHGRVPDPGQPGLGSAAHEYDTVVSQSDYSGWQVAIYTPRTLLDTDIAWMSRLLLLALGVATILLLAISGLAAKFITRPLRDMQAFMAASQGTLRKNQSRYRNVDVEHLNRQFNGLVERNNRLVEERISAEELRAKAELRALEAQVNPHFIINALESVYWSILDADGKRGAGVIIELARLFRYTLKAGNWVTLADELAHVRHYVSIEQFKFGQRLDCRIEQQDGTDGLYIPKLLIQPLVENIVKYCVQASGVDILVVIGVRYTDCELEVQVADNGAGIPPAELQKIQESFDAAKPVGSISRSYGLANLYKRLQTYYGSAGQVHIETQPEYPGTRITLRLPADEQRPGDGG